MVAQVPSPLRRSFARLERAVPPVRLVVVALAILGGVSCYTLGGLGLASLVLLPLIAGAVDLLFQSVRFEHLRVPESAFASSLILALLLPPTVALGPAAAIAVAAVVLRHALRRKGRPVFNPAAAGALLGALVFSTAPAWWASVSQTQELLLVLLGAIAVLRSPGGWRPVVVFFPLYAVVVSLLHASTGASDSARVLLLEAVDPSVLFFGFFMVAEPRTGPRDPDQRLLYGAVVAIGASLLPQYMPSLGILVALLLVNLGAALLPSPTSVEARAREGTRKPAPRAARTPAASRWPASRRVGAVFLAAVLVGIIAVSPLTPHNVPPVPLVTSGPAPSSGGGGGSGGVAATCQKDNPSISSSTLSMLHNRLGPSNILQYDANTGVVIFFDPVNQVTVTETDLFEDYGFAEFNGDDAAAAGCVP